MMVNGRFFPPATPAETVRTMRWMIDRSVCFIAAEGYFGWRSQFSGRVIEVIRHNACDACLTHSLAMEAIFLM
jgi:hypothetical protein